MLKKTSSLLFALLLAFGVQTALSQITITPIYVYLDQQNRFGSMLVMNGSQQPQEVTITFSFGYPVTDAEGNIEMVYGDSTTADQWGIHEAIRGFPRSFTVQPGQRQVVRLTVAPRNFEDGMYWSRLKTTSTPVSPPVGETSADAVTTQITYKFEQVTTVFYKHGDVNTAVEITDFTTEQTENQVEFIADMTRSGNAPFLGSIVLTVIDQAGKTIIERSTSTSIYYDYRQVFRINREELPAGSYEAEIRIISRRGDVPQEHLVPIEPVTRRINVTVK